MTHSVNHFRRGLLLSGAVVSLGGASLSATTAAPSLRLPAYQGKSGLMATFERGTSADPYFGLFSLELAHRAGLDVRASALAFIQWGLQAQAPDGRFARYCAPGRKAWAVCGRADSDDATLARWLQLLARTGGPRMPAEWQDSFRKAATALLKLKLPSGVFSVFPHDTQGYAGYALFKDNVEVLNAFRYLAQAHPDLGQVAWPEEAWKLEQAMRAQFGDQPFGPLKLALGASYDRPRFYPHGVSAPFGWMEGYFEAPTTEQWQRWESENQAAWDAQATNDFPWGLVALSAALTGYWPAAHRWLARYEPRTPGVRWNVLEETCLQSLQALRQRAPR